jgi:hypothetical protein
LVAVLVIAGGGLLVVVASRAVIAGGGLLVAVLVIAGGGLLVVATSGAVATGVVGLVVETLRSIVARLEASSVACGNTIISFEVTKENPRLDASNSACKMTPVRPQGGGE